MRIISAAEIQKAIAGLCLKANMKLRPDVYGALRSAYRKEKNARARKVIKAIIYNADIAAKESLAICQDTGLPCVFVELGQEVRIKGDLIRAINNGIEKGYTRGSLRNSIIENPLKRGTPKFRPAVIHTEIIPGSKLKLTVLPKGFGCENKSRLKMFLPTAKLEEIKQFITETVKNAGPDACPPYVVGVGIGGTADYAMLLAKKALLRKVKSQKSKVKSRKAKGKSFIVQLENELLKEINALKIGPMGLGGNATCLGVNIETYPTHIAGLPVAVNISCHALRSASITL